MARAMGRRANHDWVRTMTSTIRVEEAPLWLAIFETDAPGDSPGERDLRQRLKLALLDMRRQVGHLVTSIASDMPGLTVHDLTHLDALWEMAGLVIGEQQPLNPAEGFVLGGAILLHDAALTLAAYPGRMADLRGLPQWADLAVPELRRRGHHEADALQGHELPPDVEKRMAWRLLRRLHAERAAELPSQVWRYGDEDHRLMNDPELRRHFGHTIGQVAASHHKSIDALQHLYIDLGALAGTRWSVATLRMACLLRVADAMHVDSRRAPAFAAALNRPEGESALHWTYQGRMAVPQVRSDQLVLTSTSPFPVEDAQAWWLCLDWARMADGELGGVDRLLAERALPRLAVRSVHGAGDPQSFSADVPVSGWVPVDATVKVSDVPSLARKLGGEALYGDKPEVALRELVQNACDAIEARRRLEDGHRVLVRIVLEARKDGTWLIVEDDGCGMSPRTLTRSLLDFGQSFWQTGDVMDEFPGLLGKGFVPEGRFGIGFFSVFMLGDRVEVTSRRYDAGYGEARRLVFAEGAGTRPILETSKVAQGGFVTRVAVRVQEAKVPALPRGVADIEHMFPAVGVDLKVTWQGTSSTIARDDWLTIDDHALFARIRGDLKSERYPTSLIEHQGRVLGRAAVPHHGASNQVAVVVDSVGIFIANLPHMWCAGVLRGRATVASRFEAAVEIPPEALAAWGTRQAALLASLALPPSEALYAATQVLLAGGDSGKLPLFADGPRLLSPADVDSALLGTREIFVFLDSFFVDESDPADEDPTWIAWRAGRTVWRAATSFASSSQALAALSGVPLESISNNPVTTRLLKRAELLWNGPVKFDSVAVPISINPRQQGRRNDVRTLLRIAPA